MMKYLLGILLFLTVMQSLAFEPLQPLPADQAFRFTTETQNNRILLHWQMPPQYFLYKDRINVKLEPSSKIKVDNIILPEGKAHSTSSEDHYQVYFDALTVPVFFKAKQAGKLIFEVNYQGCSAKGFCYPPIKRKVELNIQTLNAPSTFSGQNYASQLLEEQNRFLQVLIFFGLGLLLAFTPCVLPMVPILSSIILGHKKNLTTSRAFSLSFSYVLGMALTYAVAGMAIALLGESLQAFMQKPWVIIIFSALFALLAFSLLGYYQMHLPARWQQRLNRLSDRPKRGTYVGVFLMGSLSTLVVSPCVSAPLVGVLAYIAQTGNTAFGGVALLALGFGMGVPLLLIGVSAGKLLPKSGAWMRIIQKGVGLLMLGVSLSMLSRVVSPSIILFLWGVLLIYVAFLLKFFSRKLAWRRWLGLISLIYGTILVIGSFMGNTDPLHPWENWHVSASASSFTALKDMEQLQEAVQQKKLVMIDFYADWCGACKVMDANIFNKEDVQHTFKKMLSLRANVTAQTSFDRALMKKYNVIAPPTILFFYEGNELVDQRIVGDINKKEFLHHLNRLQEQYFHH